MPRFLNYHPPVRLLENIPAEQASLEPLVAFYPVPEMEREFYIKMHLFLPSNLVPSLDHHIGYHEEGTEAGELLLRTIEILCEQQPGLHQSILSNPTYTLWQLDVQMQVEQHEPHAQGLRVNYVIGDPRTTRGTITTVATT